MKCFKFYLLLNLFFLGLVTKSFAQGAYDVNLALARGFYQSKDYIKAAKYYSKAFSSNHNLGLADHRYEAASCWALGREIDSAFYQLDKILPKYYSQFTNFSNDSSFRVLWSDPRWAHLLKLVEKKNQDSERSIQPRMTIDTKLLAAKLDTIQNDDQESRKKIDYIKKTFGINSVEMDTLIKKISFQDSINLEKVKLILDKSGWLGRDEVGDEGSLTLFLVIQHADLNTQLKYIPLLRDAVNRGKARASNLALMEDRIAVRQGRKQIYGSQVKLNNKTGKYYVLPLEDPGSVDSRRAKVGLRPISTYVSKWGITWSLEQYINDLASASQE
jgi:hypothetical protein